MSNLAKHWRRITLQRYEHYRMMMGVKCQLLCVITSVSGEGMKAGK